MREIKFRVWDNRIKSFIEYKNSFSIPDSCEIRLTLDGQLKIEAEYGVDILDPTRFVIQQYTGLKDKNGTEVYEGDIVKYTVEYDSGSSEFVGQVVFDEEYSCWAFHGVSTYLGTRSFPREADDIKVIGNIFES